MHCQLLADPKPSGGLTLIDTLQQISLVLERSQRHDSLRHGIRHLRHLLQALQNLRVASSIDIDSIIGGLGKDSAGKALQTALIGTARFSGGGGGGGG